jgi:hypothetical protein
LTGGIGAGSNDAYAHRRGWFQGISRQMVRWCHLKII